MLILYISFELVFLKKKQKQQQQQLQLQKQQKQKQKQKQIFQFYTVYTDTVHFIYFFKEKQLHQLLRSVCLHADFIFHIITIQ